jgi:hypothetical protein
MAANPPVLPDVPHVGSPYPWFGAQAAPTWADQGQFWVGLAGVVLTLGALYFVWRQIHATRQEGRADRVSALMHRHQDREFLRIKVAAKRYTRATSAQECYDRLLAWDDATTSESALLPGANDEPVPCMNDCRHVVEYFEEVAGLYNVGAIDTELAARFFPSIVVATFDEYWWLLHEFREGKVGCLAIETGRRSGHERIVVKGPDEQKVYETESFAEWEALARTFYRRNPHLYWTSRSDDDDVWIVCLPPEGADETARDAYRALTQALSLDLDGLGELERELKVTDGQPATAPKRVFAIAPWQLDLDVHLRCQRLAAAVALEVARDATLGTITTKLHLRPTSSTQVAPPSPHSASAPTPSPPRR